MHTLLSYKDTMFHFQWVKTNLKAFNRSIQFWQGRSSKFNNFIYGTNTGKFGTLIFCYFLGKQLLHPRKTAMLRSHATSNTHWPMSKKKMIWYCATRLIKLLPYIVAREVEASWRKHNTCKIHGLFLWFLILACFM